MYERVHLQAYWFVVCVQSSVKPVPSRQCRVPEKQGHAANAKVSIAVGLAVDGVQLGISEQVAHACHAQVRVGIVSIASSMSMYIGKTLDTNVSLYAYTQTHIREETKQTLPTQTATQRFPASFHHAPWMSAQSF